jgi:hypothetical protein
MNAEGHDLDRVLEGLWQCLANDKRPLGLVLGAGCPVSISVNADDGATRPLIPDVDGLTAAINDSLSTSGLSDDHRRLVTGLTEDLGRAPNIEEILSRLRTLASIAGSQTVRGLSGSAIEGLERAVTNAINELVTALLPRRDTPYDAVAVWIRAIARTSPVNVFTTNYDLLLETAFERNDTPFFDGFVGTLEPFLDTEATEVDDLPSRWARLWKLHGSTNWTLLPSGRVVRRDPRADEERRLIHPSHLKYDESRRMPYLVMLDQLRGFLKQPSATLIVLGYSFGDDHINELLAHGLRSNPSATVFALQFGKLDRYSSARELAADNLGLTLLAADAGVRAGTTATWQHSADGSPRICGLGDFAEFGAYLRKLVGRSIHVSGSASAVNEHSHAE